tara:strand:+ start:524 stop:1105 length:582 start_codon:yes stop_codon:yes gene_type:complete
VTGEVTKLLRQCRRGDDEARAGLVSLVYGELRSIAGRQVGNGPRAELRPTELVNEFYLAKVEHVLKTAQDRRHFFNVAAAAMKGLLIDIVRREKALKRGGNRFKVDLEIERLAVTDGSPREMDLLHQALEDLRSIDARAHEVIMLRFYAGLTNAQVAEVQEVPVSRVRRDLAWARAWLMDKISGQDAADPDRS